MTHPRTLLATLFLLLITGFGLASCDGGPPEEVVYEVTLLPSFGGTSSGGNGINERGWITGGSNFPGDPETVHAALWRNGSLTDLGTLGGPDLHSHMVWPGSNERGLLVGISEIDEMDPNGDGTNFSCDVFFPGDHTGRICKGFAWKDGEMIPMPTLGESGKNSFALNVNNRGKVVGWAETDIDDPTCVAGSQVKQFRAVIWEPRTGEVTELPPLPGDSVNTANVINDRGDVAGISGDCGVAVGGVSARHQVYWEDGEPIEMENLGGVNWHTPMAINQRGVVVGFSNPPEVTDGGFFPHAYIWTKHDGIHDLGTLPPDTSSQALGINERGQVVGLSRDASFNDTAVIWHDGTQESMQDLNELAPDFEGHLFYANDINNRGVITGGAVDPETGNRVAFRATPTRRNR